MEGVNSRLVYYIVRTFVNATMYPSASTTIKKKKKLNRYKLAVSQKDSRWSSSAEICYNTTKAMLGEHPE
jgi:hypothetical protein